MSVQSHTEKTVPHNRVIGVEAKFHVPGIGVPVGGFERCRGFHAVYILSAEFLLPAHAAEPAHGRGHHGLPVIDR